jgi:hypothetical protein
MREDGFSVIELLLAMAVLLAVTAGLAAAVQGAPDALASRTEAADMHQRIRVAIGALAGDLTAAAGVRPYRWGAASADPPGTFKANTITAVGSMVVTYWLESDATDGTCRLMSYSGGSSADVPVADHVVGLTFDYYASGTEPLTAAELSDGPWEPDPADANRWDADLSRVRSVGVNIAVESALAALRGPAGALFARAGTARVARRWVPDVVLHFRVAPRNMNLVR